MPDQPDNPADKPAEPRLRASADDSGAGIAENPTDAPGEPLDAPRGYRFWIARDASAPPPPPAGPERVAGTTDPQRDSVYRAEDGGRVDAARGVDVSRFDFGDSSDEIAAERAAVIAKLDAVAYARLRAKYHERLKMNVAQRGQRCDALVALLAFQDALLDEQRARVREVARGAYAPGDFRDGGLLQFAVEQAARAIAAVPPAPKPQPPPEPPYRPGDWIVWEGQILLVRYVDHPVLCAMTTDTRSPRYASDFGVRLDGPGAEHIRRATATEIARARGEKPA